MDEEKKKDVAAPEEPVAAGLLEDVAIDEEMSRDYIEYSMSVIADFTCVTASSRCIADASSRCTRSAMRGTPST